MRHALTSSGASPKGSRCRPPPLRLSLHPVWPYSPWAWWLPWIRVLAIFKTVMPF